MKAKNVEVMRKILYAVESGGQVYGKQNYSAFAGVGANTSNEKAITVGAGQWYANEARSLLLKIQNLHADTFRKLDDAGIASDLKKDWSAYGVTAASRKGKCIIALISSTNGKLTQDAYMDLQINTYADSIAKAYGAMTDDAMMECINIIHQGGSSALKRILAKTSKPYSAKTIYAALCTDPSDKSSNNQVGDYTSRQKKVYEFITKYADYAKEATSTVGVRMANCGHDENGRYTGGTPGDQSGTEWYLRSWYSYPWNYVFRWKNEELAKLFAELAIEAADNNKIGYCQGHRDTFWNQLQKVGYRPGKITTACETDCSAGTIALIKAVGHLKGIKVLQNCSATYTGNMYTWFSKSDVKQYFEILTGKYLVNSVYAMVGDINLNVQHHVNITVDNGASAGTRSGSDGGTTITSSKGYLQKGDTGSEVKTMQKMLIVCGYTCGSAGADGDFGSGTETALKKFQKAYSLEADGIYGANSKSKLEAAYKSKTSSSTGSSSNGSTAKAEDADFIDKTLAGPYKTTANLWMKTGAGKEKTGILVVPKGKEVQNYGYYSKASDGAKWLYVKYDGKVGFCSSKYLQKQ